MNRAVSGFKAAARGNERGITLVETMVAATVSLVLFGMVLTSFIAQQRAFVAALYQIDSQGDENRVLAYISRDLRQASNVSITANGTNVALTLPVQAAPTLNINLGLPLLSLLGGSTTPPATTAIQYYRQGNTIIRDVAGKTTALSSSATQFQVSLTGNMAQVSVGFEPRFSFWSYAGPPAPNQVTACVALLNSTQQ